ncbi:MAG: peptide-methionine (R)-S-oxide reductase MsrB [Terrimicrobiaceae bacterium]|nr:peptide-methionine (R)-S-oxide reductase MsrB [Terrimicrobiaceae bacterium]
MKSSLVLAGAIAAAFVLIPALMKTHAADLPDTVTVRLAEANGEPGPAQTVPTVKKTDAEWRAQLGEEAFQVLRSQSTERPFCGTLLNNKKEGIYFCAGCDLPLFTSRHKFESGTGWPSFYGPFAKENVAEERDVTGGMVRTEIHCARCGGHLGHVFEDGPAPTGLRYCLNSVSLKFRSFDEIKAAKHRN